MFGSFNRSVLPLLGFAAVICLPLSASAIQQPQHLRGRADLELAGQAAAPLRSARVGDWVAPRVGARGQAFARLEAELGPQVQARFDVDTGVLDTLIPAGHPVVGANRSPAIAEQFALDFLTRHVDLLAPGSAAADFQLAADVDSHGVRSVGLVQTHAGLEVIGGQLSLRFKHDQLVAVRSQALPHVWLPGGPSSPAERALASRVEARALAWIAGDFAGGRTQAVATASAIAGPMILPLVHPGAVEYREVVSVEVELVDQPGRWLVYLDARTAEPVARRSLLRFAGLQYTVWERSPLTDRVALPAAYVEATVDNVATVTDQNGDLVVPPNGGTVAFGTDGVYLRVYNANGPVSSVATPLATGQIYTWDLGANAEQDAQLNAYVHAQIVKDYVRGIDPDFPPLDLETAVTVNIDDICNAYADGNTINFFLSGAGCENSALIADVVHHEYGHVAHTQGLIPGVGLFDGAHSEGASDYLSATIVDDASVGRGFFLGSDEPIRELDPDGFEWRWPEDTGPVHDEGRIIGGTLWDLRKVLIDKYGVAVGVAKVDLIWLDGLRRAVDIPSTYLEALITNDDDGNLQNGTPDICEINAVFAAHGLYEPPGGAAELTTEQNADGNLEVTLNYGQPFAGCPGFDEPTGTLRFRARSEDGQPTGINEIGMVPVGTGALQAVIPAQTEFTVTQYQVELDWGNGTSATFPQNFGDPWYEQFWGEATEIWCSDFEDEADIDGIAFVNAFEWGEPTGLGGDPDQAYAGNLVVGMELDAPGLYPPNQTSRLILPSVDVGEFEVVRLQYRRWLNVEDGFWDRATISANGQTAWENFASDNEFVSDIHHRDREWRFHDVPLTQFVNASGQVTVEFALGSDGGLEFGGWTIDSLCIVGHGEVPGGGGGSGELCGDGVVGLFEQCDDGNLDNGDGCSSGCLLEDDEPEPEPEPIEEDWDPAGRGCGCVTTDERAPVGLLGVLGLLGLVGGRRRRHRAMLGSRE